MIELSEQVFVAPTLYDIKRAKDGIRSADRLTEQIVLAQPEQSVYRDTANEHGPFLTPNLTAEQWAASSPTPTFQ
jgi:hypothetical protein